MRGAPIGDGRTTELLAALLNACLHGGFVPKAALTEWPHDRLIREGWVTTVGRGSLARYRVTSSTIHDCTKRRPRSLGEWNLKESVDMVLGVKGYDPNG